MEPEYQRLLFQNKASLIYDISNPISVVEKLFEICLFSEHMKQLVQAEKTPEAQVMKILDLVPQTGANAFNILHECLLETANYTAAMKLRPDLLRTYPQHNWAAKKKKASIRGMRVMPAESEIELPDGEAETEIKLPEVWPHEDVNCAKISVVKCDVESELVKKYWNSPIVYSMKRLSLGRCLILSNQYFHRLKTRHGTEQDVKGLNALFTQLRFHVTVRTDLSAEDMRSSLKTEAAYSDHEQTDCFVCVICSHGNKEGIFGTDGNIISLDEVTTYFDGEQCKGLQSKPKLFFIQACQGGTADKPGTHEADSGAVGGHDLSNMLGRTHFTDEADSTEYPKSVPTKSDMIIACATHPGYISIRNTVYGSWFIQAVIYVFQKFAYNEDIVTLLTLVNNLVARCRTKENVMQASQFQVSLTKKVLFFPGLCAMPVS